MTARAMSTAPCSCRRSRRVDGIRLARFSARPPWYSPARLGLMSRSQVPSFKPAWGGSGDARARWRREAEAWQPRLPPRQRGYDSDWERLRASVLKAQPYCVPCEAEGVTRQARMVDHIIPVRLAPERRLDAA